MSPPAPSRDSSAATIVLIEDDDDIREIMAEVLRTEGYNVFVAADGAEGIDLVRRLGASAHLILLDYMMPVLDGSQVLAVLKGDPVVCSIPVIVVSAASRSALPVGFAGIEAWLSKPVEMERLLEAVQQVLGKVTRPWMGSNDGAVSTRFLARRLIDAQELELAIDRGIFSDIGRVARNLSAAGAQEPSFRGLVELGSTLVKASRAADLSAVREAAAEVRRYLAAAVPRNQPDLKSVGTLPAPVRAEVRDGEYLDPDRRLGHQAAAVPGDESSGN